MTAVAIGTGKYVEFLAGGRDDWSEEDGSLGNAESES